MHDSQRYCEWKNPEKAILYDWIYIKFYKIHTNIFEKKTKTTDEWLSGNRMCRAGWKEELNRQEETFEGDGHVQVMNNGFIDTCQKSWN